MELANLTAQQEKALRFNESQEYIKSLKSGAFRANLVHRLGLDCVTILDEIQSEIVGAAESILATWDVSLEQFLASE